MDPDTVNCVILHIHVDKNNNYQPCHLAANQSKCKYGSKKNLNVTDAKDALTLGFEEKLHLEII